MRLSAERRCAVESRARVLAAADPRAGIARTVARWVEASVQYALHASEGRDPERDPLLKRLPELLFMECLCEHVGQQPDSKGWLAALADPIVGRALGCMHQQPHHPWTSASARSATARPRRSPRRKLAGEGGNGTRYT
jgi:hypothetical protein